MYATDVQHAERTFNAKLIMQAYKFNTQISENGIISLPFEPYLFNKEVEIIIMPKPKNEKIPENYMTIEEFRSESKASLTKIFLFQFSFLSGDNLSLCTHRGVHRVCEVL